MMAQKNTIRDHLRDDGLNQNKNNSRQDRMTLLEKDVPFEFKDALTATWQSVGNLAAAHSLLSNLSGNATLAEFSWLVTWPDLGPAKRSELYSKYASHELHFFLARKDPDFFKAVVQPYLANKRDKTFMDHYLLGADLSGYLRPWQYSRLNTVERVLLARRIESEQPVVRRHLKDWLDTLPKNPQRDSLLFETALNGRALMVVSGKTALGTVALGDDFAVPDGGLAWGRAGGMGGGGKGPGEARRLFDTNAPADAPQTLAFYAREQEDRGELKQLEKTVAEGLLPEAQVAKDAKDEWRSSRTRGLDRAGADKAA